MSNISTTSGCNVVENAASIFENRAADKSHGEFSTGDSTGVAIDSASLSFISSIVSTNESRLFSIFSSFFSSTCVSQQSIPKEDLSLNSDSTSLLVGEVHKDAIKSPDGR